MKSSCSWSATWPRWPIPRREGLIKTAFAEHLVDDFWIDEKSVEEQYREGGEHRPRRRSTGSRITATSTSGTSITLNRPPTPLRPALPAVPPRRRRRTCRIEPDAVPPQEPIRNTGPKLGPQRPVLVRQRQEVQEMPPGASPGPWWNPAAMQAVPTRDQKQAARGNSERSPAAGRSGYRDSRIGPGDELVAHRCRRSATGPSTPRARPRAVAAPRGPGRRSRGSPGTPRSPPSSGAASSAHRRGSWPSGLPQALHRLSRLTWPSPRNSTCCRRASLARLAIFVLIFAPPLRLGSPRRAPPSSSGSDAVQRSRPAAPETAVPSGADGVRRAAPARERP